MQEIKA